MCVLAPKDLLMGQNVEVKDSDVDDPDPGQAQANMYVCVLLFNKKSLKSKKKNFNRKKFTK